MGYKVGYSRASEGEVHRYVPVEVEENGRLVTLTPNKRPLTFRQIQLVTTKRVRSSQTAKAKEFKSMVRERRKEITEKQDKEGDHGDRLRNHGDCLGDHGYQSDGNQFASHDDVPTVKTFADDETQTDDGHDGARDDVGHASVNVVMIPELAKALAPELAEHLVPFLVPVLVEELKKEFIGPACGRPKLDTIESRIRQMFDQKEKTFKCPRFPSRLFESGSGFIKHWKKDHPEHQIVIPILPQNEGSGEQGSSDDDAQTNRPDEGSGEQGSSDDDAKMNRPDEGSDEQGSSDDDAETNRPDEGSGEQGSSDDDTKMNRPDEGSGEQGSSDDDAKMNRPDEGSGEQGSSDDDAKLNRPDEGSGEQGSSDDDAKMNRPILSQDENTVTNRLILPQDENTVTNTQNKGDVSDERKGKKRRISRRRLNLRERRKNQQKHKSPAEGYCGMSSEDSEEVALHLNGKVVAWGFMCHVLREFVHGNTVKADELVVTIRSTTIGKHPAYSYPIEEGSFAQWPSKDIKPCQ